jgi:hypothetical protein
MSRGEQRVWGRPESDDETEETRNMTGQQVYDLRQKKMEGGKLYL